MFLLRTCTAEGSEGNVLRGVLHVPFQPQTHKCHLTRKHKFLLLLFMWLMPQTRQSSWPHTEITAFRQELG